MRPILLLLFAMALGGCASTSATSAWEQQNIKMGELLSPYVGRSIADYVVEKGPPATATQLSADKKLFEWIWSRQTTGAAVALSNGMVLSRPAGTESCKVSIVAKATVPNPTLSQWIIEGSRWEGACYRSLFVSRETIATLKIQGHPETHAGQR